MRSFIIYTPQYVLLRLTAERGLYGLDTQYVWWERVQFIGCGRETWWKESGWNTCHRVEKIN